MRALDLVVRAFGSAAEPIDFGVHAIFQGFLAIFLGVEIGFLGFEKGAVISIDAKRAGFVGWIHFDDGVGDIFEEIAVVADYDAGECCTLQHRFQPLDSGQI